ncbi:MAG: hypothetical protein NWS40_05090, partial [Crocinitomicaceae bacterium]|nr:hypothetical protein [Crocinitomicaceae bacterium]
MKNLYKKGLSITLFLCMTLTISIGFSQTQFVVVPTGGTAGTTNGTDADPVCRYFNSIRYQVVYTVADLNAAGMTGETQITKLAWNVTESSVSLENYTIKMGNTAQINSAANNVDATSTVKNAFTYAVALGYNDITFDTPFIWDGTSNLVVEICTGASNPFASPYGGVEAKTGVTNGSRRYRIDGSSACGVPTNLANTTIPYVRLSGYLLPAVPPTPFQIAPTTSCALGTNLDVVGTPPTDVLWYWQTAANGTSLATPYAGSYNVFTNATYYLRAYNSVLLAWSTNSSSYTVTDVPSAPAPPAAFAASNPACAPVGTTISVDTAPVGTTYYWQGTTVNGTSNLLNASSTYPVTTTGTYQVSAYDSGSSCWSVTTPVTVTVDTYIPAAPSASV